MAQPHTSLLNRGTKLHLIAVSRLALQNLRGDVVGGAADRSLALAVLLQLGRQAKVAHLQQSLQKCKKSLLFVLVKGALLYSGVFISTKSDMLRSFEASTYSLLSRGDSRADL